MTFTNPKLRYKATLQENAHGDSGQDSCFYQVEEWDAGKLSRRFMAVIPTTQKVRRAVENRIERWCELFSGRLPKDGGTVDVNLDEVQISS